jgi:DNA-binding PadR family transcriptional regulator
MWGVRRKRGLRHFVFAILRNGPRNGAEIMNDMESLTHGWWRPSPGSVYPLLDEMVEEGSVRKLEDGRYELLALPTFEWGPPGVHSRTPQDALREISGLVSFLEDLKRSTPGCTDSVKKEIDQVAERLRKLGN